MVPIYVTCAFIWFRQKSRETVSYVRHSLRPSKVTCVTENVFSVMCELRLKKWINMENLTHCNATKLQQSVR
jgi:hypothetical protein